MNKNLNLDLILLHSKVFVCEFLSWLDRTDTFIEIYGINISKVPDETELEIKRELGTHIENLKKEWKKALRSYFRKNSGCDKIKFQDSVCEDVCKQVYNALTQQSSNDMRLRQSIDALQSTLYDFYLPKIS